VRHGLPLGRRPARLSQGLRARVTLEVIVLACLCASCGRMGLPSPPVHIMERTGQLQGMQRGSIVYLWWPPPAMAVKPYSKYYVDHVDIYKLIEHRDQDPTVDPIEYLDKAELVKFYSRSEIERQTRESGRMAFYDTLDFTGNPGRLGNTRLRYAIRYVNKYGEDALFSNSVEVNPNPNVAMPPMRLVVSNQVQDKITLSWDAPLGNVNGKMPANVVGYNIYKRVIGSEKDPDNPNGVAAGKPEQKAKKEPISSRPPEFELLNKEGPLSGPTFTDTRFRYLTQYEYMVRALSAGESGLIESENSIPYPFTPKDTFKPSPPDSVTIASANAVISLFWPANPETDVVGYNIYRSDSPDAAAQNWVKLNPKLNPAVTFRDETPRIGIRYYYRVTAVDRFDNESDPSAVVSEVANP
jgi:hypothetical protein